ncbi:hypothetical protein [Ornithinimicrobium pratense]|uniref:Uncharacterized protein n=1 Tax=Ornithinimicrobium pratense TaxID=2593973 RepID=A0A5J6V762_9MICO|nr:hypothetical protein [Ornithinimicrobium pratense]QFG69890.1 hypothetical protein FY030_15310 [Ornithinimicrobium pratense]
MTSAPADLTVHLEPPPGWVQIPQEPDAEGAVLLALAPADWREDWGVRPNIVVGLGAPTTGTIRAVATRTAATFLALEAGHRIVSWDLWHDEGGRRLLVTYPAGTALVAAMTWVRLEGGRPLSVTATVDADRYLRVMPLMMQAVDTLRVEGTVPEHSAPPVPAAEPADEPRTDDFWSGRGETLEDLGRLQQAQPWAPDGLPLSRAAFAAFAEAGRGLRGPRVKDRSAVEELQQAGLVDASGRLTEDGRTTHAALAGADRRIRVESAAAGVPGTFEAARLGDTALVWATDPPSRWAGGPARGRDALESATTGTLQWIPLMHLPEELAAWLQVGPAWPMATSPPRLPRDLVTERAEDDRVPPPPDADDHLRSAWAEPWFTWVLTTDTGHAVAGVHAGRHGHFRLAEPEEQDGVVDLQAFPSEPLFTTLVGASLL